MSENSSNGAPQRGSRRRLPIWFAVLLSVVVGIFWLLGGFYREPAYQGKRASYWLDDASAQSEFAPPVVRPPTARFRLPVSMLSSSSTQLVASQLGWMYQPAETPLNHATEEAFRAMGDKGVRFLIKTINHKPSPLLVKVVDFIDDNNVPTGEWIEKQLPDPDHIQERRGKALGVIGALGPRAAGAAIPELARVFTDAGEEDDFREMAGQALADMGEAALAVEPQLIEALKSTNGAIQVLSARILGLIGPRATASITALRSVVQGPQDDWFHYAAAAALWKIDRETNILIQVCSNLLAGIDTELRCNALEALAPLGATARALDPIIQTNLLDADDHVRWEAEKALRQIDPESLQAIVKQINQDIPGQVSKIVTALKASDGSRPPSAIGALMVLGPQAAPAVPALIELLDREAARMSAMHPFAPPRVAISNFVAGSSIIVLSNRISPTGRAWFATGWSSYNPLAAIRSRFGSPAAEDISLALAEIGPAARAAVPELITLLREPGRYSSVLYCKALGAIGPEARDAVPVLEDLLATKRGEEQLAAAEALIRIAPERASNAVPVLRRFMEYARMPQMAGSAQELRAATALWRRGLEPDPPVDALINAYEARETFGAYFQEKAFVELLGEIGPKAKAALPLLRVCLEKDPELRRAAAIAIRKIDPEEYARLGLPGTLAIP